MFVALTEVFWIKTVGAPRSGDPRDGELHQTFGPLVEQFDLEPWDDDTGSSEDAHYVRSSAPPNLDDEGRLVWTSEYRPKD